MRFASVQPERSLRDISKRQRTIIFALVALLHLLLLFLLLRLAPPTQLPKQFVPISVDLLAEEKADADRTQAAAPPAATPDRVAPPEVPPIRPDPPDAEPAPVSSIWSQVIPMTREQMAAADIGKFKSSPKASQLPGETEGASGSTRGGATDDSSGPGTGPNGETLYNARWYREPTNAELSTYMPSRSISGWGIVACQTIANYRVDNCQEIAQSPAGSGLAGAVRKAAWQFRVMPPRIGGKVMVGAWVRIRIDYERAPAEPK